MTHHGQTMLTRTLPVPRSGVCRRVTSTEVVVSADAVLWNVPYLLPAAAPTVRPMEVFTPSSGGRRNVVDTGSPSNDSEDVIAVYVTRGLIKAKKSGVRRRTRRTGKIK